MNCIELLMIINIHMLKTIKSTYTNERVGILESKH